MDVDMKSDEYPIPLHEIEACFPPEEDPTMKVSKMLSYKLSQYWMNEWMNGVLYHDSACTVRLCSAGDILG